MRSLGSEGNRVHLHRKNIEQMPVADKGAGQVVAYKPERKLVGHIQVEHMQEGNIQSAARNI